MALHGAIWLLGASVVTSAIDPSAAAAGWAVGASGNTRARAQTIPTAATPTASATNQDVTVSWTATTLSGGTPASGYVVRRYDSGLVQQTILANCASVATNGCIENNVPAGTWTYSVQATAGNWLGAEGARSTSVTVTAAVFTITANQKVKSAANVTGGTLSGYAASEAIAFRLDTAGGTALTGSITAVNGAGTATGFTVTIPAGTAQGNHTIVAIGGTSGRQATSGSFLFDSVAPTNAVSLGSAVNAYLNGLTLYYRGSAAGSFTFVDTVTDAGGSGPASATFPAFAVAGWTAAGGSVSTPSGGPYTSPTYSWTVTPTNPANRTITGFDVATNTVATIIAFTLDSTPPAFVAADVKLAPIGNTTTPGFIDQGAQYYVYAKPTDALSGVNTVTANVNNITAGQTAAPLAAGSWVVAGVTYTWRSAALTADNPHAAGSFTITGTATDRVGNATTTPTAAVIVDNTNPTGTVTAPSNGWATASTTVTSNSADATAGVYSADFQYSPAGAGTWTSISIDTATPFSVAWNTTGLTDGAAYDLRVITTDNAGNTFTSATVTVTVDRTAPAAPSTPALAAASDTGTVGDNITSDSTPTYTGTAEAGTTVRLYDGVTQVGSATATGGNWSITASVLTAGAHTITATATDGAGNVSASSASVPLTVDTTGPAITNADIRIAPVGNTTTPGFLEQGATYYIYANATDGGSGVATVTANVNNITTGQTAVPLVAGSYVVAGVTYLWRSAVMTANPTLTAGTTTHTATATDVAGTATNSGTRNLVIDNTNPTGTITAPSSGWAILLTTVSANSADVTAGVFSAEFQYSPAGAGTWTSIAIDTVTPFSVVWDTTSLTNGGSYDVRVVTTDNASNVFTSPIVTVTVDNIVPAAPSTPFLAPASDGGPDGDYITNDNTPTFTGTAEAGTTVKIFDGVTQVGTATATGGNWSITTSALSAAAHTITATATDLAGNVSPATTGVVVTIDTTPPTVTGATTANGNVVGQVDVGDIATLTFSEQMDATTFCSVWTNSGTQTLTNATVTIVEGADTLVVTTASCTFGLGTWFIGDYVENGNATFVNSTVSWNPTTRKLTVTLGALGTYSGFKTGVGTATNEYTDTGVRTDVAGNAVGTNKFTNPTGTRF